MKIVQVLFASAAVLVPSALAQSWEVGGGVGGGFYTSQDVTTSTGSASAKLQTGWAGGAWLGNNLSGHYETSVVGGTGVLVFTVQNSSVLGILTADAANLTPDQLADYFQQNVQPGT